MKKALLTSLVFWLLAPIASLCQRAPVSTGAAQHAAACGKERWAVKTLTDPAGETVAATSPTLGTVAELAAIGAPTRKELLAATARRFPQEKIVYRVSALVIGSKQEVGTKKKPGDQDFHIVVADPSDVSITMIAEIPKGSCVAASRADFFDTLRQEFETTFEKPAAGKLRKLAQPVAACVTGVGFFDLPHNDERSCLPGEQPTKKNKKGKMVCTGQDGVAPNGFELHPVLSIVKGACAPGAPPR